MKRFFECGIVENVCRLPKETGQCLAYFPSYYFDREKSACLMFVWGGCGGNANRFATTADCEKTCLHDSSSFASTLSSTSTEASTKDEISTTGTLAVICDDGSGGYDDSYALHSTSSMLVLDSSGAQCSHY